METKFNDVTNLYLGCEMITEKGNKFILMPSHFPSNWRDGDIFTHSKPILRPLSDMTNEEKINVAKLVCERRQKTYAREKIVYEVRDGKVHLPNPQGVSMCDIEITKDGVSFGEGSGSGSREYYSPNQFKVTAYLLKQGFDLFGLIESSQAIDKTTLTS